jgi:hypothetical protein
MKPYVLPPNLRTQDASATRTTVVAPPASLVALWATVSVLVSAALGGLFAFGAKRSGASSRSALTWGLLGGLAPAPLAVLGGAYLRAQQTSRPDVGLAVEATTEIAGKQLVVKLPEWTKARLHREGRADDSMNANVRAWPWGPIQTGLPEGTVVEVLESTVAPEPGSLALKTWHHINTLDGATTGWMHGDLFG